MPNDFYDLMDINCMSVPDEEWEAFLTGLGKSKNVSAFSIPSKRSIYMKASAWSNAIDGDASDLDDKLCYHEWLHLFVPDMHIRMVDFKTKMKAFLQCFKFGFDCRCAITQAMLRWGPKSHLKKYWAFVELIRSGDIKVRKL